MPTLSNEFGARSRLTTSHAPQSAAAGRHEERRQRCAKGAAGRGTGKGEIAVQLAEIPSKGLSKLSLRRCEYRPTLHASMSSIQGRHVGIAPQCSFNSYVWRSRIRDWWRLVYMPNTILLGLYRPGVVGRKQPQAVPLLPGLTRLVMASLCETMLFATQETALSIPAPTSMCR